MAVFSEPDGTIDCSPRKLVTSQRNPADRNFYDISSNVKRIARKELFQFPKPMSRLKSFQETSKKIHNKLSTSNFLGPQTTDMTGRKSSLQIEGSEERKS